MNRALYLPKMSQFDPEQSKEGALDPLGLESIADHLGTRLAPGIRERQKRLRFLTAMAAGSSVCQNLSRSGRLAKDNISEPWQVYEWHVVQGLVSFAETSEDLRGVPGREKVALAIKNNIPLSSTQYLKTPGTFGFHGVYRVLAEHLDILSDTEVGDHGYELISTWEREQSLQGFFTGEGIGRKIREELTDAIEDAMTNGYVTKRKTWSQWPFFSRFLNPLNFGQKEADLLYKYLVDDSQELRAELIKFIESQVGQSLIKKDSSERQIHDALKLKSSPQLKQIIETIQVYESFCRLLTTAFYDSLRSMTILASPTSLQRLSEGNSVSSASKTIPELFLKLTDLLHNYKKGIEFESRFSVFKEKLKPADWILTLLKHHTKIQAEKPPSGKNSWIEQVADGRFVVRPGYRQDRDIKVGQDLYVHTYRTNPIWSFLIDLKKVKDE